MRGLEDWRQKIERLACVRATMGSTPSGIQQTCGPGSAAAQRQAVSMFLQTRTAVDPNDPNYAYHSQGIVDTLNKLLEEFRAEKATLDEEWGKAKASYESTILSLEGKLKETSHWARAFLFRP